MKRLADELYNKIAQVTAETRESFKNRGVVIPVANKDGSITLNNFTIVRQHTGFYAIINRNKEVVVDQINLPQTAAVLANKLALGQFLDKDLLNLDRNYGYALFDEQLHERALKSSSNKSLEYFDLNFSKCMIARAKKEKYKSEVVRSFTKLQRLV